MVKWTSQQIGDVTVVELEGQIDGGPTSAGLHEFVKAELAAGKKKFALDFTKVKWINSLGVGVMIATLASTRRENADLALFALSERVATIMQVLGVIPAVFADHGNQEDALQGLAETS